MLFTSDLWFSGSACVGVFGTSRIARCSSQNGLTFITDLTCAWKPSATEVGEYDYTRSGNPTRDTLERQVQSFVLVLSN